MLFYGAEGRTRTGTIRDRLILSLNGQPEAWGMQCTLQEATAPKNPYKTGVNGTSSLENTITPGFLRKSSFGSNFGRWRDIGGTNR